MKRFRRVASVVTMTAVMAAAGLAAMPTAHAGLPEAEPPAAYAITSADLLVSCALATVDLTDGTTTVLPAGGSAEACVDDLAVAPDGSVWGVIEVNNVANLVRFDPATGAVLSTQPFTGVLDPDLANGGLAFDGASTLYVQLVTDDPGCDGDAVCLYTVDRETAAATFVGNPGPDNFFTGMLFLGADCGASLVTGEAGEGAASVDASWDDGEPEALFLGLALSSYDKETGILTDGPLFPDDFSLAGLDYSRADGTLYALGVEGVEPVAEAEGGGDVGAADVNASLFVVDPATADVTEVAALSEPNLNILTLGIAGECVVPPPPPAPLVLEPTFTG
jgi:hypothetical protein